MAAPYDLSGFNSLAATLNAMVSDQDAGVKAGNGSPFAGGASFATVNNVGPSTSRGIVDALRKLSALANQLNVSI